MTFTLISHSLSLKRHRAVLTRSWLVAFESSSGKGLETPKATQLAKMARRIKISNGLESHVKVNMILLEVALHSTVFFFFFVN